jgi:hypothetical protein
MPRLLPITWRTAGALNDLYVTNMEFNGFPFEQITVPTLVMSAMEDTLAPCGYAKARAERISHQACFSLPSTRAAIFYSGNRSG